MLPVDGATATVATGCAAGAVTLIDAVALRPFAVAVITAVPAATPETEPLFETDATCALLLLQLNVAPLITLPF